MIRQCIIWRPMFSNRNKNRAPRSPQGERSKKAFVKSFRQTGRRTVLKLESLGCRNFPISVGNLPDRNKFSWMGRSAPCYSGHNPVLGELETNVFVLQISTKPEMWLRTHFESHLSSLIPRTSLTHLRMLTDIVKDQDIGNRITLHLRKSGKNVNKNYSRPLIRGKHTQNSLEKT